MSEEMMEEGSVEMKEEWSGVVSEEMKEGGVWR